MKHNKGFSLVELMVVVGLISGIAVVMMNLNKNMMDNKVKLESDVEIVTSVTEIIALLSSPENCVNSLFGRNAANTPPGTILNLRRGTTPGVVTLPVNTPSGNASIVIKSYSLSDSDADVDVATNTTKIIMNYQRKKAQIGGSGDIIKKVKLNVTVDALGNITECRAMADSDIWSRGAGTDIFYAAGFVAIDHSTPTVPLDVAGPIKSGLQTRGAACTANEVGATGVDSTTRRIVHCTPGLVWSFVEVILENKNIGSPCSLGSQSLARDATGRLLICR